MIKKVDIHVYLLTLFAILIAGCEKEGPMGPPGPEGPPGNPGVGGGGVSEVRAYRTNSSHEFRWQQNEDFPEYFELQVSYEGGAYQNRVFIPGDSGVQTGAVLVYFEVPVDSEKTVWYNLPHNTDYTMYHPRIWFDDQKFDTFIGITAEVDKGSSRLPEYPVERLRVVVLPAGNVIGNQAQPMQAKQLELPEVMKKYNLQDSDFTDLQ